MLKLITTSDNPFDIFILFLILEWKTKLSSFPKYIQEELKDTKGVIIIRISKKNRQHNSQKKKYRRTNNIVHDKIALTMRYTLVVLVLIFAFHIWSLHCYFTYVIVICFAKPPHIAKDEISLKIRFLPGAFKTTPRYFQGVFD